MGLSVDDFVGTRAFSSSNQGRTAFARSALFISFRELMSARGNALLQLFVPIHYDCHQL